MRGVERMFVGTRGRFNLVDGLQEAWKCGWRSNLVVDS